jgi:hypothetical protein
MICGKNVELFGELMFSKYYLHIFIIFPNFGITNLAKLLKFLLVFR